MLFLLLISTSNAANELQRDYYIDDDYIMLSDIVDVAKTNDVRLYKIDKQRHSKRIKSTELIKKLKSLGYANIEAKHARFVQFNKKSPISTVKIEQALKKYYNSKYKNIQIKKLRVAPMNYLEKLPETYSVHFEKRAYLANSGVLYIKTQNHRKIFFKYILNAVVNVYQPRTEIRKGTALSVVNTKKNSIMLDKFRAMPLQEIPANVYQARHHIKTDKTITKRDITGLNLVKRGSLVNVSLQNGAIFISFTAKAVQKGKLGDTILIVQSNGKKMRAVVVGKNRAEVK